jgi:predicted nucleic acid-binding protein
VIVYLDASVILRVAMGEAHPLAEWRQIETSVTSALAEVECARTLDRLRLLGALSDKELGLRRETVSRILAASDIIALDPSILARAAQPFSTSLGTLDAIHLASALLYRDAEAPELRLATHDEQLGTAAKASGMSVLGLTGGKIRRGAGK